MKKLLLSLILLSSLVVLTNMTNEIVKANDYGTYDNYYYQEVEAFGPNVITTLVIRHYDPLANNHVTYFNNAKQLLKKVSDLSDNFRPASGAYLKNVYYINNRPGENIEIDPILYDIIKYSLELKELTNGYFDISIGKIISGWKDILDHQNPFKPHLIPYTHEEIAIKIAEIKQIEVIEDGIHIWKEAEKHYIKIDEGVEIDLGAISKGYGVELVYEYFKSVGLKYFSIHGSGSSLKYAEKNSTEKYNITVKNPITNKEYGSIFVENTSVTTSGDTHQSYRYDDMIIHHIISPITKQPENFYRILSIVNSNAAYSDALTTAMFSMDKNTFNNFVNKINQNEENKLDGFIVFESNGTINDQLKDLKTENKSGSDIISKTMTDWLVLSGVVIIMAMGFYAIKEGYGKKKIESSEDD